MKNLIFLMLTLAFLSSCTSNNTSKNTAADSLKQVNSLKQELLPILKGVWVSSDYIEAVEKTKSPLKSADFLEGTVAIIIDGTLKADSIKLSICWNNHEGDEKSAYLTNGQNVHSLKTNIVDFEEESNFYELGYETIDNQNFLFLYHYSKANKLIDKRKFSKVAETQPTEEVSWGLQYAVNKALLTGTYQLTDVLSNKVSEITFTNDGNITGHGSFKTYRIETDFLGGPPPAVDLISFNIESTQPTTFALIFKADGIYLYSIKGNEEQGETLNAGKLMYKLVKK